MVLLSCSFDGDDSRDVNINMQISEAHSVFSHLLDVPFNYHVGRVFPFLVFFPVFLGYVVYFRSEVYDV